MATKNKLNYYLTIGITIIISTACVTYQSKVKIEKKYSYNEQYEPLIEDLISKMTLEEKTGMLHGFGMFVSGGVERLGIPEFHYTDGPNGIREELHRHSWEPLNLNNDYATFFPTGSALAATWNKEMAYAYGEAIGLEARARNKDMLLGPAVNIMRTPLGGRTFEYFSEDPYLNTRVAVNYTQGVQNQNVAVCVKHFAANNQEYQRNSISVEVSERALREIYLPAYRAAIEEADAMGIMGAYNKFRGEYLCQHSYLNNQVLKNEFGFKGMVVSDWGATHNTVTAALGGLDVEMGTFTPGQNYNNNYFGHPLRDSVLAGVVPIEVINDKVRRILRVMYNLNKMNGNRIQGELASPKTTQTAYNIASESIVLLKNDNNTLPLNIKKHKSIAVIGLNAKQSQAKGGFTAGVKPIYEITPLEGLQNKLKNKATIRYAQGYEQEFEVKDNWRTPPVNTPNRALLDEAVQAAKSSDIAIIFAGNTREIETETLDRTSLDLPFGQNELIQAVSAVNPNTIVVIIAGGAVNLGICKQSASAILYAWFNGSEAGNAIADVLLGAVNPSGKLPFTIPEKLSQIGAHAFDSLSYPGLNGVVQYKEDILVGYRWLDKHEITPAYPFGHGLSYTTFSYSQPYLNKTVFRPDENINISVKVKNTGKISGKEVVQCYMGITQSNVLRPVKELKAFAKTSLKPGTEDIVELSVNAHDLAYFDEKEMNWVVEPGLYKLYIGSSSRDIKGTTQFEISR
ncbi:MAG: glycoside hydrolase family 3 C-terminal domain-containing protein [Prolixibacteraceae bacterium]|nr:glycoside hydrolase family 3 C-terminal domain-containing protein [Prolixibacteraceae bacterium]MBN2649944.1 glycoside hydrolase family 3 C-terminal domain-containing protein [Prolixibacteraceae bacterium]